MFAIFGLIILAWMLWEQYVEYPARSDEAIKLFRKRQESVVIEKAIRSLFRK